MQSTSKYLFVYGTLMQDFKNEMSKFLASHSQFISNGYFNGKLFEVDGFPGAILSEYKEDKVYGSIFKLNDNESIFKVLDVYEGIDATSKVPDLYKRNIITSFLENGEILQTWVYIYNLSTTNLVQITSGKYV
jgi:gamma-glutamylcyclotransferase (GGCT)/AIG2-like uncharacterized protein YtfP